MRREVGGVGLDLDVEQRDLVAATVALAGGDELATVVVSGDSIPAQLTAARGRVQVYGDLSGAAATAAAFDDNAYNQAITTAKEASEAYAALRAELLASAGIADGSDEAWQDFVLKGEAYRDHLKADHYPKEGEPCLYCRQPLGPEATALPLRYREFATDAARQRIQDARNQATTLSRRLAALNRPALAAAVRQHREDNEGDRVLKDAEGLLAKLDEQATRWEAAEVVN